MSSFYNTGGVGNQVAQQEVHGNVFHGDAHYHLDPATAGKRLRFLQNEADFEKSLDDNILDSLAYPEMFHRRANIDTPYRMTCQWIFDLPAYNAWVSSKSGLLWIKGKPGSGKSTLMAHLYRANRLSIDTSVGKAVFLEFFLTARGTPLQRSPLGMFRSLLNQIFRCYPKVRNLLRSLYQEKQASFGHETRVWEWQQPELEKILFDMVLASAQQSPLIIFIDALDEAGEDAAQHLACYFHDLNDRLLEESGMARICISCRHYPVIPKFQATEISVDDHNRDDITSYVEDRLKLDDLLSASVSMRDRQEWQALVQSLVESARGVFQWVCLVVPRIKMSILQGDPLVRIQKWLAHVPAGLSEVYRFVFEQLISHGNTDLARSRRLFQWVCLATRPLTVTEIRYALANHDVVDHSSPLYHHYTRNLVDSDANMERYIRSWSGGLIEVQGMPFQELVQPIHQSVNDFCLSEGLDLLTQLESGIQACSSKESVSLAPKSVPRYHGELYWCCLSYISQNAAEYSGGYWRISQAERKYPLLKYAVANCLIHAKKAKDHRGQDVAKEAEILRHYGPAATEALAYFGLSNDLIESFTTPLHFAAAADRTDLAAYVLSGDDAVVNATGIYGKTALHMAARPGHLEMMKMLIDNGADTEQVTPDGATPLVIAAAQGHIEVFSWLSSQVAIATVNSPKSALYAAAEIGSITITKFCIEQGVDVNAVGGDHGSALQIASKCGHEMVVQMLLKAGADVNAQERKNRTALYLASMNGHETVVQMLLNAGAVVHSDRSYYKPLKAASEAGHGEIVQRLLKAGASANVLEDYSTALCLASACGHERIVRMLLEAGADINAQEESYGTALCAASAGGHELMVKMLLDVGADINAYGIVNNRNALHVASESGHERVVRRLLGAGADVNLQTEDGTALCLASARGLEKVVQLLLEAGADIDVYVEEHGTALTIASTRGHNGVVRMLLEAGAQADGPGGHPSKD